MSVDFSSNVVSGKVSDLLLLQKRGLLGTIVSAEFSSYLDQFKDKQRRWVDLYNNYYTIAYNVNRLRASEVPVRWEDLLESKWSDKQITLGSAQLRLVFRHGHGMGQR